MKSCSERRIWILDNKIIKDKKQIATLFYEPSTRTSASFHSAATQLGYAVLPINEVNYSSVTKGETLEDTIRTIASYVDLIVLRHGEKGAAQRAAAVSSKYLLLMRETV